MGIFDNVSPDFWNNLQNFGMATMAAGGQPGATTLGAIGQGGVQAGEMARQNMLAKSQSQLYGSEAQGKQLSNAMSLRSLNMGNSMYGLPQVNMPGIPNLMAQQPQPQPQQSPPTNSTGQSWAPTAGTTKIQQPQMTAENSAKMQDLYPDATPTAAPSQGVAPPPQSNGMLGYSQGALEVARGLRPPQNIEEATQAASVLSITGMNSNRQKELEGLVAKNQEPQNLKAGSQAYYPLGQTSVAASQHVNGLNAQNQPVVTSYTPSLNINGGQGAGGRNIGGGAKEIKTGFSPEEEQTQKNFFGKETDGYNAAIKSQQNLELMQHSIDTLNKDHDFLSTGKWGANRLDAAKGINEFTATFGGTPFDPNKVAAGESLLKTTGRLGFDLSKQLGAREPGVITTQAIALNPGIENTPKGIQLLKNSVNEEAQRVIDEHNFKAQFYSDPKNGYSQQKAEQKFDSMYKPELYAKRAYSLIDPIKVNNVSAAKQLLVGTKFIDPKGNVRIVPPGMGITPPQTQAASPPAVVPAEPPAPDEGE